MRQFTMNEMVLGEAAMRELSTKAQWFYNNSDPCHVYGLNNGEETFYYVNVFGRLDGPMSLHELDEYLVAEQEAFIAEYEKDEFDEEEK